MKTKLKKTPKRKPAGRTRAVDVDAGSAFWRSMDTAPKGGGAERTDDPKWVEPPKLLMAFDDGSIEICHWDWYYAPGGNGHTPGVSAWIGAEGQQVARFQGDPIAWMPLPLPPNSGSQPCRKPSSETAET